MLVLQVEVLPFINAQFLGYLNPSSELGKHSGVTENKPDREALGKALRSAGFEIAATPGLWEGRGRMVLCQ